MAGKRMLDDFECKIESKPEGREVNLSGDSYSLISTIPTATKHCVNKLEVTCNGFVLADNWQELLDIMSISCSNIRILSLHDDGEGAPIPLGSLWKLMALDSLQSLTITAECEIISTQEDGPDQLFQHLCLSAKHKETPLIMLDIGEISGQSLSLTALQHVCDHLPHLRNLSLSFDSSLPYNSAQGMRTPLSIVRSRTTRRHPLQRVCIHDSRSKMFKPKEYRDISMLFIQLFPDLDSLRVTLSEEEAWINEGWDLINDLWIDFQGLEDAIVER